MAAIIADFTLLAFGLRPRSFALLAVRDEGPPCAVDFTAWVERDAQRQLTLPGGAKPGDQVCKRTATGWIGNRCRAEDEFEKQSPWGINHGPHPKTILGGCRRRKAGLDVRTQPETIDRRLHRAMNLGFFRRQRNHPKASCEIP